MTQLITHGLWVILSHMVFSASVPKHLTLVLYIQIKLYKKEEVNLGLLN